MGTLHLGLNEKAGSGQHVEWLPVCRLGARTNAYVCLQRNGLIFMTLWPQHAMLALARRGAAGAPRGCGSAMCHVLHISPFLRDGEEQAANLCASISMRAHRRAFV